MSCGLAKVDVIIAPRGVLYRNVGVHRKNACCTASIVVEEPVAEQLLVAFGDAGQPFL